MDNVNTNTGGAFDELDRMRAIGEQLEPKDEAARGRILDWVNKQYAPPKPARGAGRRGARAS